LAVAADCSLIDTELIGQPLGGSFRFNADILSTLNRAVVVTDWRSRRFLQPVVEPSPDLARGQWREVAPRQFFRSEELDRASTPDAGDLVAKPLARHAELVERGW
jgi:hypothetical protein